MTATDARSRLIAAATEEIRQHGWAATSMQRVRERAGVSNGSLFHHFPTRTELEAAVLGHALAEHHATMLQILQRSRSARSGIRNVVRARFEWIADNPGVAMLLLASLPGELREQVGDVTRAERAQFFADVTGWLRSHGWSGRPQLFVMLSMWLGAANELARTTMSPGADAPPGPVVDVLADAAWRALSPHLTEEP
jgi:AcrR family transcriptional regulator